MINKKDFEHFPGKKVVSEYPQISSSDGNDGQVIPMVQVPSDLAHKFLTCWLMGFHQQELALALARQKSHEHPQKVGIHSLLSF
jgi:hypothetical protein